MLVKVMILLFALVVASTTLGEEPRPSIPAIHVSEPPDVDGDLSDVCWRSVPSVEQFHFLPDGTEALEPTTAWICYDHNNVYVAFRCRDSQPDRIVTQQKKRGGSLSSDDWVGLELACYGDRHPIVWFDVSASGIQAESLQSGDVSKIEWRGDWHAAAKRLGDGYTAEMSIPFSILQYDPASTTMAVAFVRQHARSNHTWWSPNVGPTGSNEPRNYYQWRGLNLPTMEPRPLIMAYVLAGTGDGDSPSGMGLDVKHALTSTITAALTANPDFRNVEQSVNSVDFTYNEQFQSESRPFFQEGSGYFPGSDIFYTRRIEEMDVGGKVYGKYRDYSLGMLNARRFGDQDHTVVSVDREWPDKARVYLRGVQSNVPGKSNTVGKMSYDYYLSNSADRKIELDYDLTMSSLTGVDTAKSQYVGVSSYGRPRTLEWAISRQCIDPGFAPILGYNPEVDRRQWHYSLEMHDNLSSGNINHWETDLNLDLADHTDGSLYYHTLSWYGHVHWQNETGVYLDLISSQRRLPDIADTFSDRYGRLRYRWNSNDLYRLSEVEIAVGKRAGGDYLYYGIQSGWLLTDKLSVRASYAFSRIAEPSPRAFSSNQLITTLAYDMDDERTLAGRLVARDGNANLYLAYKQRVRAGMDVYVIYGDPNADSTRNSLLLKLIRPL